MKLCPQCLIPYDDDQKYCSRCGSSLIEDPDAAPAAPEEPETEPERELPEQPEIAEEAPAAPEIEDFPEAEEEAAPPVQPEPEPKKNPREEKKEELLHLLFLHTTTLGVRCFPCERYELEREFPTKETPFGNVTVKHAFGYGVSREKAEYEDLARIAREKGLSLRDIKNRI